MNLASLRLRELIEVLHTTLSEQPVLERGDRWSVTRLHGHFFCHATNPVAVAGPFPSLDELVETQGRSVEGEDRVFDWDGRRWHLGRAADTPHLAAGPGIMSGEWPYRDHARWLEMFGDEIPELLKETDEDMQLDMIHEHVIHQGECVFGLGWDSGAPGAGAGIESVYALAGVYFTLSMEFFGPGGPHRSLEGAIGDLLGNDADDECQIGVNNTTTRVTCTPWSEPELIGRLDLCDDSLPTRIAINGREWSGRELLAEVRRLKEVRAQGEPV